MSDLDFVRGLVGMLFNMSITTSTETGITKDAPKAGRASPLKEPAHPATTIAALVVLMVVVRLVLR